MSAIAKKRSMRLSMASRQSLASLMTNRSFSIKSGSGSSRTIGAFSDSRCYKHSPRVGQQLSHVGEEMAQYEAEQWRGAFGAMGGLRRRGVKAPKPFTVLNKTPYHCPCMARAFEVRYGEIVKLQPPVFRKAKKADRPQICNCITKEVLPVHHGRKFTDFQLLRVNYAPNQRQSITYYLPKSCVFVRWDPLKHSSVDKICEWLSANFGQFLFTTRTASNSMLVAFETMEQAQRAVQFPMMARSKIFITWHEPAMFNFGHFTKFRNYTVGTDPIWKRGMEEKVKSRSARITQATLDAPAKPKRLKITESGTSS